MAKLRWKIAVLVGSVVIIMLLIVICTFNFIIHRRMDKNAQLAFTEMFSSDNNENSENSLYSPELIFVSNNDNEEQDVQNALILNSPKEKSIINWCKDIEPEVTKKAEIEGNDYYVFVSDYKNMLSQIISDDVADNEIYTFISSFESDEDDSDEMSGIINIITDNSDLQEIIGYVDITGELEMIRHMNIVFIISALIIGLFGSTAGYFIGRKLEQSQLAQKQFFENTSHELKTPLTSIRGYAEGIEKGIITDYKHTGRTIAAQTEKMSRLVEEILCMAKLESGSVKLSRENIEVSEFIQDCLMPFEGTVLNRRLEVALDLQPMTVSADPDKLEHAVSNLLTNALKYARTKISVACGNGTITISNDCEKLSDDTIAHLFDRFYTGRDGNTGIGLSIAKDLIELHEWRITAAPTEDGICFTIHSVNTKHKLNKLDHTM